MSSFDLAESVLLSMGSNIDPVSNILSALELLAARVDVVAASRVFETDPVTERPTPKFLNAALEIRTDRDPVDLKYEVLRPVEAMLGRERTSDRNAPRTIDLDIALFGSRVIEDAARGIEIPDSGILLYSHIALPLTDLAPEREHPVVGRTLGNIASMLGGEEGVRPAAGSHDLIVRLRELTRGE